MIDRLRYAVRALVLAAHPTGVECVWDPSTYPRSPTTGGSIIAARIARGPSLAQSHLYDADAPTSILWTIADPVASSRVGLRVAGVPRTADLGAVPTATDARDALLAVLTEPLLGSALLPGVTAAAVGPASIRLTGAAGTLYAPLAIGSGVSLTVESSTYAQHATGRASATIELAAFAQGRAPGAIALLMQVESALRAYDVNAIESVTGVTFARHAAGEIVDLTAMAGAEWESRAVVRIALHLRLMRAVPISDIGGVDIDRLRLSELDGSDVGPDAFTVDI